MTTHGPDKVSRARTTDPENIGSRAGTKRPAKIPADGERQPAPAPRADGGQQPDPQPPADRNQRAGAKPPADRDQRSDPEPAQETEARPTRRRGAALEAAILDAAWELLSDVGYNGFTIDAIAERARTSKPVLYRRWATREELLRAAIRRHGTVTRPPSPDTGTLRGDVIELLRSRNGDRISMMALMSVQLGTYFAETNSTPADLRRELLSARGRNLVMQDIVDRAVLRGECRAGLPPRVVSLPFDLFRGEAMMTLRPLPDETIVEIVDDVFLPLVRPFP